MTDYTSNKCLCFNGDFIKLFNRTIYEEGSGVTGVILVVIIYVISIIVSTLLLYEYLVYVHKDARILDLWRRVKGNFCNKVTNHLPVKDVIFKATLLTVSPSYFILFYPILFYFILFSSLLGPSEEFFIPDDFEVSHSELLSVCARAENWRGVKGTINLFALCYYSVLISLSSHTVLYLVYVYVL